MHRSHVRSLVLLLFAAACGSDTAPRTPAAPTIARIVLADSAYIVFGGAKIPLSKMATAYDAQGNVIPNPALSVSLPAGFTLVADTVVAPNYESKGPITIKAAAGALASMVLAESPWLNFSTAPTDSATITSIYDLRGHGWQAQYGCRWNGVDIGNGGGIPDHGANVDSAFYTATVDTVYYQSDSTKAWITLDFGGSLAQLPYHAQEVRYIHGGAVDTIAVADTAALIRIAPDSMMFQVGVSSSANSVWTTRENPGQAPRAYGGGTWCDMIVWGGNSHYTPTTVFTQTR